MGVEDDESVVKKPKKKDRFKALGCTGERLAAFRELIASRNCENADEDLAKAIMSVAKLEGTVLFQLLFLLCIGVSRYGHDGSRKLVDL